MNKDSPVGRMMTLEDAMTFWKRCQEASKVMGPLSKEERLVILGTIGREVTAEELKDLCASNKVLVIKQKTVTPFPCDKCGLCCKYEPAESLIKAGLPVHAKGVGCGHLQEDDSCAIYDTRPEMCRVDAVYKYYQHLTWDEYVKLNRDICEDLQKQENWKPKGDSNASL